MELPVLRYAEIGGNSCQSCEYWLRYDHSYGQGVCVVAGRVDPPRWSMEIQVCDGWKKGDTMSDETTAVGWPWTLAANIDALLKRATARNLPLTLTPQPGERWLASLGPTQTATPLSRDDVVAELERITR